MSEKGTPVSLKSLAVISAVALGGSYVGWKQHVAKQEQAKKEAAEAMKQSARDDLNEDLKLMVGSKNPGRDVVILPDSLFENYGEPIDQSLLPSSKSFQIVLPAMKDERTNADQIQMMPSSKSGLIRILPSNQDEGEELHILPGSKSIGAPVFSKRDMEGALWRDELIEVDEPIQMLPGSKSLTPIFPQKKTEVKEP